jgi:hypothetical protein
MKTKVSVFVIAWLCICSVANAQLKQVAEVITNDRGGARNLSIGFIPYGFSHINISKDSEKYKYDYKSYLGFNIGYETQLFGASHITEVSYAKAKFDKYDLTGASPWFNADQTEDISSISLSLLMGKTLNKNKRLQFPLYAGPRFEYLSGGPIHNFAINLCGKVRVKFYITDNIGIFAGSTAYIGWGAKKAHDKSKQSDERYTLTPSAFYVDAGLVIGLNKNE